MGRFVNKFPGGASKAFRACATLIFILLAPVVAGLAAVPDGCGPAETCDVGKSGYPYSTIQSALNTLSVNMSTTACVVIRDTQTYSEQVTVRNFTNNGYRLKIMADPTFISSAPAVNPPVASTAAFYLINDSVTVQGINVISTNTVPYGVRTSSADVVISSVIVNGDGIYTAGIAVSSRTEVSYSSITVPSVGIRVTGEFNAIAYSTVSSNVYALWLTGSNNAVSFSALVSSNASQAALYMAGGSSNTVTRSVMSNWGSAGINIGIPVSGAHLTGGASYNTISLSTVTNTCGGPYNSVAVRSCMALNLTNGAAHNTITQSYIINYSEAGGYAVRLARGLTYGFDGLTVDHNTISFSTISSNADGGSISPLAASLFLSGASSNTITQSYILNRGQGSAAAMLGFDASDIGSALTAYNNFSQNTIVSGNAEFPAFDISQGSFNVITQSFISNSMYDAVQVYSDYNTISQSTITSTGALGGVPLYLTGSFTALTGLSLYGATGPALWIDGVDDIFTPDGSSFNTVAQSTLTSSAADWSALVLNGASSCTISGSYIQGSTAAYISGSTGTVIGGSVFVATNTAGYALRFAGGGLNLALSTCTLAGGAQGAGIYLDSYNSGVITLSSNTISGGQYGLNIAAQNAGAALSIASMTFSSLTAGATAINFLGGQFVSTFTAAAFNSANIAVNVSAGQLSAGSRITMKGSAGVRNGSGFENDISGYVDWPDEPPSAVGDLAATAVSTGIVSLDWTSPGPDGNTGTLTNSTFTIQYATYTSVAWSTSSAQINISTTGVTAGTSRYYTLNNLSANTTYYFRLWTKNAAGNLSALSNGATALTLIETPTSVYFDEVSTTAITVSAYAAAFTGIDRGISGVNITTGAAYGVWGSTGNYWTTKAAMPTARWTFAAGVIGGRLYAVGGYNGSSLNANEEYDPASNAWTTKAVMPTARFELSAGVIGGKLYALGGQNGGPEFNTNEEYDSASNTWAAKAVMPTARAALSAGVIGGRLYAVGGFHGDYLATNEEYDPASNTWTAKAAMPTARIGLSAVVIGGRLYAVGGGTGSVFNTNEEYDPETNTWAAKAAMPTARWALSAAAIGGKLYAAGGEGNSSAVLNANEEYDPASNIWAAKAIMTTARAGLSAGVIGGRLYAVGGFDVGYLNINAEYTPGAAASFTGLTPNTQYSFKAKARNQAGAETGEVTGISTDTLAAVAQSAGSVFTNVFASSITVNWSSGTAAGGYNGSGASYKIQVSTASDFSGLYFASTTYNLYFTTAGLSANTTYYFRAQAYNAGGMTDYSWLVLGSTKTNGRAWAAPSGCYNTLNVYKDGTGDFAGIQSAVNALSVNLTTTACVVIRDTQTYSEQVTVRNFTNNGYRLKIMADPTFVSSAPAVNPPAASTAAFHLLNDSVTVQGINVISTNTVPYGIRASSSNIDIASINVVSGGKINVAGIVLSSWSALSYSSITVQAADGLAITGSDNAVSFSTMAAGSGLKFALLLSGVSSNTITRSYMYNTGAAANCAAGVSGGGAHLADGAVHNTISQSTITANVGGYCGTALHFTNGASFNTVTQSYIENQSTGYGARLGMGETEEFYGLTSNHNTISFSTITSNSPASINPVFASLHLFAASSNTVTNSYLVNRGVGHAVAISATYGAGVEGPAGYNTFSQNIVAANSAGDVPGGIAFMIVEGSHNVITQSYISNLLYDAVDIYDNYNTVSQSTIASGGDGYNGAALYVGAAFNTLSGNFLSSPNGIALLMDDASRPCSNNTVTMSTLTSSAADWPALYISNVSSNTLSSSYIQGSTAAYISGSTGTIIGGSVFVATNTAGYALRLAGGSLNLTLSSSTLTGGGQGTGIYLDVYNSGALALSSNTISGGKYGLNIATQSAGAALSITSMTFSSLTAGATAINFGGGVFVSTFSNVNFSDTDIAVNVDGGPLGAGSRITMRDSSGQRAGGAYERDPQNLVDWSPDQDPAERIWDGGGAGNNASVAANWLYDVAPQNGDSVRFDGTNGTKYCNWDLLNISLSSFTMAVGFSTSVVAASSFSVTGDFSVAAGTVTWKFPPWTPVILSLGGNFDQTGGVFYIIDGSQIIFNGTSPQSIRLYAGSRLPGVSIKNPGSVSALSDLWIQGQLVVSSGTFDLGAGYQHRVAPEDATAGDGYVLINGGVLEVHSSTLTVGNGLGTAMIDITTGTLSFLGGDGTIKIHAALNYVNSLWFGGSGDSGKLASDSTRDTIMTVGPNRTAASFAFLRFESGSRPDIQGLTLDAVGMDLIGVNAAEVIHLSSANFSNYPAGSRALYLENLSGNYNLDGFSFDASVSTNVDAASVGAGAAAITMTNATGPRAGPGSENDPNNLVAWSDFLPTGCGTGYNVKKDGSGNFTAIQAAVDVLPANLGTTTCVIIRDTQTYSEQVTVRNFTNNGYRLKIMADPTFISSAPAVNPPYGSNAAFWIINDSVSVLGINIISTNAVAYAILASSASAAISSVNVVSGGMIGTGISISSLSAVSCSSITVQTATGLKLTGLSSEISFSTITNNSAVYSALYLAGSASNTVTGSYIANTSYYGAYLSYSDHNTISGSTITSNTANYPALGFYYSGFSAVTRSYISNPAGVGARLTSSHNNTISDSTVTSNAAGSALYIFLSDSNTVARSYLSNPSGYGARLSSADNNTISGSTITGASAGYSALFIQTGSSNTVSGSYIQGSTAAYISVSTGTVINSSVLVAADTAGHALRLGGGNLNLALSSSTLAGGPQGAGVYLEGNNSGAVSLSSNTINGGQYGLNIAAQSAGAALSIASMTFSSLTAGATAINFLGGQFVSTFTGVNFADTGIAANVNASALAAGSRLTMREPAGAKMGTPYENDPDGYVDWDLDEAAPSVAVTDPVNGSYTIYLSAIVGTAYDGVAVSSVQITIRRLADNYYWDGGVFAAGPAWLDAAVFVTSWTYGGVPAWVNGSSYTVVAKARDSSYNWTAVYATSTFVYGAADHVEFYTPARRLIAGTTVQYADYVMGITTPTVITVALKDALGNVAVSSSMVNVRFSAPRDTAYGGVDPASPVLSSNPDWKPLKTSVLSVDIPAGQSYASIYVWDTIAGTATISAEASGGGLLNLVSQDEYITPGTAASFTLQHGYSPGNPVRVYAPATIMLRALDAFGNVAAGDAVNGRYYTGTVRMTVNPAGAAEISDWLAGTTDYTFVPDDHGERALRLEGLMVATVTVNVADYYQTVPSADSAEVTFSGMVVTASDVSPEDPLPPQKISAGITRTSLYQGDGVMAGLPAPVPMLRLTMQTSPNGAAPAYLKSAQVRNSGTLAYFDAWIGMYADNPVSGQPGIFDGETEPGGSPTDIFLSSGMYNAALGVWLFDDLNVKASTAVLISNTPRDFFFAVRISTRAGVPRNFGLAIDSPAFVTLDSVFVGVSYNNFPIATATSPVAGMPLPAPPALAADTAGISSIAWNWELVPYAEGYRVVGPGGVVSGDLAAGALSWPETGLSANTAYTRMLTAFNVTGVSTSAPVTRYTLAAPPAGMAAAAVSSVSISVSWSMNTNASGTNFEISYSSVDAFTSGYAISTAALTAADSAQFSGLAAYTTYYFRVRAYNGDGLPTAFDSVVSARTLPPPPAALTLTASALGISSISWSWGAVPYAAGYRVISFAEGNISGDLSADTLSWPETGLSANTAYTRLAAVFNATSFATSAPVARYTLAAPPAGTAAAAVSSVSVSVSWSTNTNAAGTNYEISYSSVDAFTSGFAISTAALTANDSAVFSGLLSYTTYYFRVRAYNGNGFATAFASAASIRTLPPPPVAPEFSASVMGVSSISWSWGAVPYASGYRVLSSTDGSVSGDLGAETVS